MSDTLILNADGSPLSVIPVSALPWQDSIKVLFLERASVIAEYEDWTVSSPSLTMNVPAVMLLNDYIKPSRDVKFSRYNVFLRDEFSCQYCDPGKRHNHDDLTLDHVTPRFHGGKTKWDNVVCCCGECNVRKAHFTSMKPRRMPVKPTYYDLVAKRRMLPIKIPHPSWNDYLGWEPSLVNFVKRR